MSGFEVGDGRAGLAELQFADDVPEKIIVKAGLTPWPRLFHNLRSSRQTELQENSRHTSFAAGWAIRPTLPVSIICKRPMSTSNGRQKILCKNLCNMTP